MKDSFNKNVTVGGITLEAIAQDRFAVPGRGSIQGRANAIRAAKNMIAENSTLRAQYKRGGKRA